MKNLAVGCLVVLVLVAVASGVATYYIWRAAAPMVESMSQMADGVKRLGDVADIDRGLTTTARFDPPDTGEFTAAQLERFFAVQTRVRAALGARTDAFAEKYRELTQQAPDGTVPSLPQLASGLADMSNVYLDARRAQVEAMNAAKFSREEFSWVRLRVYQAAGLDVARYDAKELERFFQSMASGVQAPVPDVTLPDAPAANRALVKPHAEKFTEWLPMAFFGL
jgi:hypothetical protein